MLVFWRPSSTTEEFPHGLIDKPTQPAFVIGHLSAGSMVREVEAMNGSDDAGIHLPKLT